MKYFTKLSNAYSNTISNSRPITTQFKNQGNGKVQATSLMSVPARQLKGGGKGTRYYEGVSDKTSDIGFARVDSQSAARYKMTSNPADSMTTRNAMKKYKLRK